MESGSVNAAIKITASKTRPAPAVRQNFCIEVTAKNTYLASLATSFVPFPSSCKGQKVSEDNTRVSSRNQGANIHNAFRYCQERFSVVWFPALGDTRIYSRTIRNGTMQDNQHTSKEVRALSVGKWSDPLVSVAIIVAVFLTFYATEITDVYLTLLIVLVVSAYLFFSELTRARWKFKDRPQQKIGDILDRTLTKFYGVLAGTLFIFFAVWLFPAYEHATNIGRLQEATLPFLAFIIPVSFFVILATEFLLGEKRDGTYQLGLLARWRVREIDWRIFFDGFLEWLLRCFFLLINFYAAVWYLSNLRTYGLPDITGNFVDFILRLDLAIFGMIIFAILPGYVFASRLIGTELKKVDRTWFGWAINLSCYPPLNAAVFGSWVGYRPSPEMIEIYQGIPTWAYHTLQSPALLYVVAGIIIFLAFMHLWGEAILGIRAANMSSRGIITTGPFSFTRHPIYVSKCFQWGFLYFPVLNAIGFLDAIQSGLLFFLVCAIYAGRALGEEKLLATDENYVKYALYMDDKSMFAFVGRLFPVMTFRWRYEYWKKRGQLQY